MHRVVHFEIHSANPDKAGKFYAATFGWTIRHLPEMDYWLIDTGGGMGTGGGFVKRRGPAPAGDAPVSAFVCSLGVESVDDIMKKALDAGATVALPKMAIPGVGWQAYLKDLDGNIFGLHQPDTSAR